jgi:Phage Connector (GP10).
MKGITDTELSMLLNNATAIDYEDRLHMLAVSLFNWDGLDEACGFGASRFLEESLYRYGKACVVKDEDLGLMALNVTPAGKLNIYYLPIKVNAFSTGYNKIYDFDDVVYIMNNEIQKPTKDTLTLFAARLYETERTADVNLQAQKTPVLIEGDKNTLLTLRNVYMNYSGNMPVIYGNKRFDLSNKLNVLRTDAPFIVDKLEEHKHNLWNDCMTFLGINNANTSKKKDL